MFTVCSECICSLCYLLKVWWLLSCSANAENLGLYPLIMCTSRLVFHTVLFYLATFQGRFSLFGSLLRYMIEWSFFRLLVYLRIVLFWVFSSSSLEINLCRWFYWKKLMTMLLDMEARIHMGSWIWGTIIFRGKF